jgi:predicted RNA polymerase sigma factor
VVRLNLAVAVGMSDGPAAGLAIVDDIAAQGSLARYPHLPAVRGELLDRLGRHDDARTEFAKAAALTRNERERHLFTTRSTPPPHPT